MPAQFTRLMTLAAAVVLVYFIARHFLVPASFGEYGWYRGDALAEIATAPSPTYAGRAACAECHDDILEILNKGGHRSISCESCHGPSATHAGDPTLSPAKIEDRSFCVRCHAANPSRPAGFPQVEPREHAEGRTCVECHQPHEPAEVHEP